MISRKQLYAAGETFGDSCTRAKLGGGYVCGFGGSSKSSSATTNQTNISNADKRAVVDGGSVGITGDGNALQMFSTSVDSNSVEAGKQIALASIATNATNIDSLHAASEALFGQIGKNVEAVLKLTGDLASSAQRDVQNGYNLASELTKGANAAYSDAAAQATGNKSLILAGLAVVGLGAVVMFGKK